MWLGRIFLEKSYLANNGEMGVQKLAVLPVKLAKKDVKFLLLRIFLWETYAIYIYSCSTQVGGLYGKNEKLTGCEKGVIDIVQ